MFKSQKNTGAIFLNLGKMGRVLFLYFGRPQRGTRLVATYIRGIGVPRGRGGCVLCLHVHYFPMCIFATLCVYFHQMLPFLDTIVCIFATHAMCIYSPHCGVYLRLGES